MTPFGSSGSFPGSFPVSQIRAGESGRCPATIGVRAGRRKNRPKLFSVCRGLTAGLIEDHRSSGSFLVQVYLYFSCSRTLRPCAQVETIELLCGSCGALVLLLTLYGIALVFIGTGKFADSVFAAVFGKKTQVHLPLGERPVSLPR
jgi:hypothetical protein